MVLGLLNQLQLTIVSNRIARAFNRSGATRAVALGISKTFDRVGMLVIFLTNKERNNFISKNIGKWLGIDTKI